MPYFDTDIRLNEDIYRPPNKIIISINHKWSVWSNAKRYLEFIYSTLDDLYSDCKKISQLNVFSAFYLHREFGTMLGEDENFECLIDSCKILSDTHELKKSLNRNGVSEVSKKDKIFEFNKEDIINPEDLDAVNQTALYWINHKKPVQFSSVYTLLENKKLLRLISELKIDFLCENEPFLSERISSAIRYTSKTRDEINRGNPNFGKQVSSVADDFAKEVGPIIHKMDIDGIKSIKDKTQELNRRKIKTIRGKTWYGSTVSRTYKRWQKLTAEEENKGTPSSKTPKLE
ncbi:hypothetical protein [Flavisericum labens]|uniref:hypothetical protein n=1 Tax=Flavisericum labens TaxID=3377112 RepID=UPI00387B7461